MKLRLIYPRWRKLEGQTEFHLPPHGPVVFAAALPADVEVEFIDENVDEVPFDTDVDLVGISMMLTAQVTRGWAIADWYRERGVKVIFGGIATMLHAEETRRHADAVFLGEVEGRLERVLADFRAGALEPIYDYLRDPAPIEAVGTARRDILHRERYAYGGVQMVDLVHASRGCRFNCYPCCVAYLGGRTFRPRPFDKVVAELASLDNERVFLVDNSLAQDTDWELGLFEAIKPLQKRWISHPIENRDHVVKAAAEAGCWYVYQAIFDTSDHVREKVRRLQDHGIGVEGTILLGMDEQSEDDVKRLVEFLMEIQLDLAEFTILTPFPETQAWRDLEREGRILTRDWEQYTADRVVFQPKQMSPEKLQELYAWAWETFYGSEAQRFKMYKLLKRVVKRGERRARG
jgi:radical SAM superfamily enzyme YgiQ (UPF0313 family)